MSRQSIAALWLAALSISSCAAPGTSPSGFRLPEGDVAAGGAAVLAPRSTACHQVRGMDLPGPVAGPPVPVALGGTGDYQPTDGRFVTSIINPSHKLARGYPKEHIKRGGISGMPGYRAGMTVGTIG